MGSGAPGQATTAGTAWPVLEDWFEADALASFTALFCAVFFVLVLVYSAGYRRHFESLTRHIVCLAVTLALTLGAVFASNLVLFLVCWGALGLLMYLLIAQTRGAGAAAIKTFILIGAGDALMILGVALLWRETRTMDLGLLEVPTTSAEAVAAYLCLAVGALTKAGAMPFHTWVPDVAERAAIPVSAYLPASLDKLLGIYFLARLSLDVFVLGPAMNMLLMVIGAFTIVAAVMMALIQHDMTRLLGYHAVSQVGYMVLAIGTGSPLGIAAGLFHMLNNTLYKTCLFMTAGAVRERTGTTDLDKLGGLGRYMPFTFASFLIAALAISGVPPLNGFTSKWMIYHALIEKSAAETGGWLIFLICAMFGSVLTLASFMKLAHAVFLGQRSAAVTQPREVSPALWGPCAVLAVACVVFGLFPYAIPLRLWIEPSVAGGFQYHDVLRPVTMGGGGVGYPGVWSPLPVALLLLVGVIIGGLAAFWGLKGRIRVVEPFVGGERLEDHPEMRVSGTAFYDTVRELPVIRGGYALAAAKVFDLYEVGAKLCFAVSHSLSARHTGLLPQYVLWCMAGLVILLVLLS
ncbi:MAG: NADH-quinone oxidoreductase subunit L [Candidatus Hydrogenedentota bacterium]